jgi:hypothetical protein
LFLIAFKEVFTLEAVEAKVGREISGRIAGAPNSPKAHHELKPFKLETYFHVVARNKTAQRGHASTLNVQLDVINNDLMCVDILPIVCPESNE